MKRILDYTIIATVAKTYNSEIYRAYKDNPQAPCILKILNKEYPTHSEIARFRHEYEIIKKLNLEGVVKPLDFFTYENHIALVLEDFQGISLKELIRNEKPAVEIFLQRAIAIADTLGNIHKLNVIHKDIKPSNILMNQETGTIKITDFGIAHELSSSEVEITNPDIIDGTLAYLSPEQTGRLNRAIDYRTDIYSLGITFYEMLTGKRPFVSDDPMEIIHSHIAKVPEAPQRLNPGIPVILSNIIMKLLAKTADDRYQNCFGLKADLGTCLDEYASKRTIDAFELGTKDIPIKFTIPSRLYGREHELEILYSSFERIAQMTSEMLLVTGTNGIGKTTLINEIRHTLIEKHSFFITGKFDQFKKDIPFSAVIQALSELIETLLTGSAHALQAWKEELLKALSPNARVITDLIPGLELIIGEQPDVAVLNPEEAQNRFNLTLKNFMKVFAKREHPCVLFLDDVQYADISSIQLIKTLSTSFDIRNLLIIGTYREHEINDAHPFLAMLKEIRERGAVVNKLSLSALHEESVNKIVAGCLHLDENKTRHLSALVNQKTEGNPFFVNQFLKMLFDEGFLRLDPEYGWGWDMEGIARHHSTENVVDLLRNKIAGLSPEMRHTLELAAAIGSWFDFEMISELAKKDDAETIAELNAAIEAGYIIYDGKTYAFSHERIREAMYDMIAEERRVELHHTIGNLLVSNDAEGNIDKKLFFIVKHMNLGRSRMHDSEAQLRLVELNLRAATKAKASTSYSSALGLLRTALSLLPENHWETNYDLSYTAYLELAECEYLMDNYTEAEELFSRLIANSHTKIEKAQIYSKQAMLYTKSCRYIESLEIGRKALMLFSFKLPRKGIMPLFMLEILKARMRIRKKNITRLLSLPEIQNAEERVIIETMYAMTNSAVHVGPELMLFLNLKSLNYSLQHGISKDSSWGIFMYGVILYHMFGDKESGRTIVEIASQIAERYKEPMAASYGAFSGLTASHLYAWETHIKEIIPSYDITYSRGIQYGDLYFAGYGLLKKYNHQFIQGAHLDELLENTRNGIALVKNSNHKGIIFNLEIISQLILCLQGRTVSTSDLSDATFNEVAEVDSKKDDREMALHLVLYRSLKLSTLYLFGHYKEVVAVAEQIKNNEMELNLWINYIDYYFYTSLALCALYPLAGKREKRGYLKKIDKYVKKIRLCADRNPDNFLHKCLLVEAELARALHKDMHEIIQKYNDAILAAQKSQFLSIEALGNELLAHYLFSSGFPNLTATKSHIYEAIRLYERWGASAKVNELGEKYENFISQKTIKRGPRHLSDDTNTDTKTDSWSRGTTGQLGALSSTTATTTIDLQTVLKASETISGQIVLSNLLQSIMKIVVENAGAERGFFILDSNGELLIEAEHDVATGITEVLKDVPVNGSTKLSEAIVNYVYRTQKNMILADASGEGIFTKDSYVVANKPKSVLCTPIMNAGKLSGIIYMENNVNADAFVPERLELLRMISSQAAVSIDNARLYANLEAKVEERTEALKQAMNALWGEMALAKKIQTVLLPKKPAIPGYEIAAQMIPADEVGGDYYDVINSHGHDWVVIGDVSGHGIPAGLVMMMAQTAIHLTLDQNPDLNPSELIIKINRTIYNNIQRLSENKYMTITVLASHTNGRFYFSGLHQNVFIYRTKKKTIDVIETRGMWIGMVEDIEEMIFDDWLEMDIGDVLLLFTDGITESTYKANNADYFGEKRLANIFQRFGDSPVEDIKNAILAELTKFDQNDDITMVVAKRKE